jgi:hypothetical protein
MKLRRMAVCAACLVSAAAVAQQITPLWVETINGLVHVLPENQLPTLLRAGGDGLSTYHLDGTDVLDCYANFLRYDDDHYLLGIRENGLNENDPGLSAESRARAKAFPDRSIIWIDAKTGKPLGIALTTEVFPARVPAESSTDPWWKWGISDGPHGQRVLYTGFKYKILRYAPNGLVSDARFPNGRPTWSTSPTEAWVEPVSDEASPSLPSYVDQNDPAQLAAWLGSSGGDGSVDWRWKAFRVTGSGNETRIWAGGATWRSSMQEQEFVTEDNGLTFFPIARLNDSGEGCGAKGESSLGGEPSGIRTTPDGLEWCIQAHFPAAAWTARPNRYVKTAKGAYPCSDSLWWIDLDCQLGNIKTNQPLRPHYFDPVEGALRTLPAFDWEAAGKDGTPIDHHIDGVQRYDGNWVMTSDTAEGVDYIVTYAIPSWNQQFGRVGDPKAIFKPGWIGLHTLDGRISKGNGGKNSAFQIPCYETDEPIVDPYGNGGTGYDYCYDGDLRLYPDPDGKGGSTVLWCGALYGFGVFRVANVPAAIVQQPQGITKIAGESVTLTSAVSGGANLYQWMKDGNPIPMATSPTYTIDRLALADSGQYKLRVFNRLGNVDSDEATLTVVPDEVPPMLTSLTAALNPTGTSSSLNLEFSKPVSAESASDLNHYAVNGGVTIFAVTLISETRVTIQTSPLAPGQEYILTINNVRDQSSAGNVIATNSPTRFQLELTPGYLLWEFYPGISGNQVDAFTAHPSYPEDPARREFLTAFTTEPSFSNVADNFGARLSGWLTPAQSGNYRFFISSSDSSQLLLSSSADPTKAIVIAQEPNCCTSYLEPGDHVPQTSAPQTLVAGRPYYLAALQKGGTGNDYLNVAWRHEGDTTPAHQLRPIPGIFLSSYRAETNTAEAPPFGPVTLSDGQITLTWSGAAVLEESTDLKTWQPIAGSPVNGYTCCPAPGHKFYRLSR